MISEDILQKDKKDFKKAAHALYLFCFKIEYGRRKGDEIEIEERYRRREGR